MYLGGPRLGLFHLSKVNWVDAAKGKPQPSCPIEYDGRGYARHEPAANEVSAASTATGVVAVIADSQLRVADSFRSRCPALAGLAIAGLPALLIVSFACGGSTSAPSTLTVLSGSVTDSAGDAVVSPVTRNGVLVMPTVAVPPDLVAATITVSGGNLAATISFVPGTLSHSDTLACLLLDVDENPATGGPFTIDTTAIGYDYSVCAVNPRRSTTAQVSRLGGGSSVGIGSVPATFPSDNQVSFTVPLLLLGNDDGRLMFKVAAVQFVDDPGVFNTGTVDLMPDAGRPGGLVR